MEEKNDSENIPAVVVVIQLMKSVVVSINAENLNRYQIQSP